MTNTVMHPLIREKISLGCLEINFSDLKYLEYWKQLLIYVTFIFNFTICLIFIREIYFSFNCFLYFIVIV